ncbi:HNH endonuclease [Anaeromyxobacter paludicola]
MARSSADALGAFDLARRLRELAGDERNVQADFLLHLDAFDRHRAYLDAGHASLWEFCLKALHLREGAAGRRIGAMRVLRRFPALEEALRDGRLCLSTLGLLGPVLTEGNREEMLARAAFQTRAEVERLIASIQPRPAPKDGIRRVPGPLQRVAGAEEAIGAPGQAPEVAAGAATALPAEEPPPGDAPRDLRPSDESRAGSEPLALSTPAPSTLSHDRPASRPELRPVSEESYSLRLTLDAAFKGELDQLRQLLSHKLPNGDLAAVLREAVRCAIEKHGKRRGAVAPKKVRAQAKGTGKKEGSAEGIEERGTTAKDRAAPAAPRAHALAAGPETGGTARDRQRRARRAIPAALRREVWARDGGQCAWRGEDGRRCESRWQLELDHVIPVALGGATTADNLRLACRAHNILSAERAFGREHMARFRRAESRQGEFAIASGGGTE